MKYKDTVLPILREVRGILLPEWGTANVVDKKTEVASDVVTILDTKVEKFLKEKLAEAHPDIHFVGEEEGGDRNAKRFWLVDPIDGTGHYVRGLPFCTTMIALIEDGVVTFGAIYDFLNDDIYWAEKGQGAYKNDSRIYVNNRKLEDAYVSIESRVYKEYNQKFYGKIVEKASYFCSINCGWEMLMVASGKLEGRVAFDSYGLDYDFAPGSLIVAEAGGIVTNIGSDKYDYRNTNLIVGNPIVHKELEEIFKGYTTPK